MPGGYITGHYVTEGEIDGFRDFRTMTRKGLPHVIVDCNFLGVGKPSRILRALQPFGVGKHQACRPGKLWPQKRGLRVETCGLQSPRLACLMYLRGKRLERSECVGGFRRGFSFSVVFFMGVSRW